jgi:hypothetical protein
MNIAWNSGERARSRSGLSSSTTFSKGTSRCAKAVMARSRTPSSKARNPAPPSASARSVNVLMKKPISGSISARSRLACGVPTVRSCCPE